MTTDKDRSSLSHRMLSTALVCYVVGISLTTAALLPIVLVVMLVYAVSGSGLAPTYFDYDSFGVIHLVVYILPPCPWWWLYTKTMRRIALRLNLTQASKELGTPFAGKIAFVAGLLARS